MFKTAAILLGYLVVLITAVSRWGADSLAQTCLFGVVPVLWLDRWLFRLVPWPADEPLHWEIARRAAWFLGGALTLRSFWHGTIPWQELLFLGAEITFATALLEGAVRFSTGTWRWVIAKAPTHVGWASRWREAAIVGVVVGVMAPLGALHPPHIVVTRQPAVPGLNVADVWVPTTDGLMLHGILATQQEPRALLIFCHGHRGNCGHVHHFLKVLQPRGFNVLACDFRGHGASPGHTTAFGLHEKQDVIAAVQYLRGRYPGKPLFLAGISYGAAVVLQALPDISDVSGVWVEGSFARFEDVVQRFFRPIPEPLRAGVVTFYDTLGWLDCGFHACDICPIQRLQNLQVPICFCHGRLDDLIPFEQAEALYASYGGPKSCLWFDDGHHYGMRTKHEVEYFSRFCKFLEHHLKK